MVKRKQRQGNIQPRYDADNPFPNELYDKMIEDAGLGVSTDPSEMMWDGGDKPLPMPEREKLIEAEFSSEKVLAQILWQIIKDNPNGRNYSKTPKGKSKDVTRLEEAMNILIGENVGAGPPTKVNEDHLQKIAERYFLAYAGGRAEDTTLRQIAKDVVLPNDTRSGKFHKDMDKDLRPTIRAFNDQKDELLTKVSWAGLEDLEIPKVKVARILEYLADFGIIRSSRT